MVLSGIPGKVIDRITKELGLQTAVEGTSFDLLKTIQPIIEMKEEIFVNVVESTTNVNVASITLFTTPTDRDFFLTGAALNWQTDVTSTNTATKIEAVRESGQTEDIIRLSGITATVKNFSISRDFIVPIKLKRGSIIVIKNAASTTQTHSSGTITGYTRDIL